MLEPAMFMGLGAVALWAHVRFRRLLPGSLSRAVAQVMISFAAFALLPAVLSLVLPALPSHALRISATLGMLMLVMTYLLLTWVWLIARILHDLSEAGLAAATPPRASPDRSGP